MFGTRAGIEYILYVIVLSDILKFIIFIYRQKYRHQINLAHALP